VNIVLALCSPLVFFFPRPPPPPASTLSLHDALPISRRPRRRAPPAPHEPRPGPSGRESSAPTAGTAGTPPAPATRSPGPHRPPRSEEHTSELQSRENLVCRLLLEKKKNT